MGTDWRDNDPEVEPVVEIYQGHRHNYEHFGAPGRPPRRPRSAATSPRGSSGTRLKKGYRLGFQSSSDHVSTHLSYAIVLTRRHSRQAIIDAFKKRHCYAATDNIILDVRCGEHLMGDIFETDKTPTLEIAVDGTRPSPSSTSSATTSTSVRPSREAAGEAPLHRRRREAGRDALLLRPRRAGRRQPRLGLADVDHVQEA